MSKECSRINCPNEAKYFAGLEIRAHTQHKPAKTTPIVFLCEEHKDVKWEDLVNDEGWQKICNNFLARGLMVPQKQFSNIYIREIPTFLKNLKPMANKERRFRLDLMEPAELAIHKAMQEVEKIGANVKLTEATMLLEKAKNLVSDYLDTK